MLTDSRSVQKTTAKKPREVRSTPVRFIPLGGLNEIGKNLYVYECSNDMFIVDCGVNRNIHLFQKIRQRSYMILMTVSYDYSAEMIFIFLKIGEIGNYKVYAWHFL